MSKSIFTSLSPNTNREQLHTCLNYLFNPVKWSSWKKGESVVGLEKELAQYIGISHAVALNSGRAALYYTLKAAGVSGNDEVMMQAYTCISVPNAPVWLGAKPVYIDVKDDFNIDPEKIAEKITKKTKAIIVQHTFGKPADIERIMQIAKEYKIAVIEDCAHALGAEMHGKKVGSFGDLAIFSFGRDKVISGVVGGAVTTNNDEFAAKLRNYEKTLKNHSFYFIKKCLLYPLSMEVIKKTYNLFSFGKVYGYVLKKLHIIPHVLSKKEKRGEKDQNAFRKLPNACADLALRQLQNIEQINRQRREKAAQYNKLLSGVPGMALPHEDQHEKHIYLRYAIQSAHVRQLHAKAKENNIYLGDWYDTVIAPCTAQSENVEYKPGECPNAEKLAASSINLPNHHRITEQDQKRIVSIIKKIHD